jgi:hypothetical protein
LAKKRENLDFSRWIKRHHATPLIPLCFVSSIGNNVVLVVIKNNPFPPQSP